MIRMVPDPIVGTTLGSDYRVIEEIGRGGMAVVYLVEHQTLLKQFAAKVLSHELTANFEARARFTQEAHAASQLDHENIVTISDFGATSDQRPFFVMELLRGHTLDQRIASSAMSLEEIAAISIPIGRALAHAHAEGVVHRDVKPENIFLVQRSQGRWGVKVVDFGIAKAPVHNAKLTKMGQTLGSPMFMAPEACRGDDVDHRADIYSLGVLLYLMLCGRLPFEDDNLLKVLQMQVSSPLPPPRSVNPALEPAIAVVLERALAKDPDDRYPSMLELLDAFEAALPAGADRLLLEAQRGSTQAIRTTPFPGVTLPMRTPRPGAAAATGGLTKPPEVAEASPPRNRKLLILALLSVVFAVLGVAFALKRTGTSSTPAVAGSGVALAVPPPVAAGPAPAAAGPAPAVANQPTDAAVPLAPAVVMVHVVSTPAGATVTLDGESLGVTPLDVEVPRGERTGQLVISYRGYVAARRTVDLRGRVEFDGSLTAQPKVVTRPKPRPEPKLPRPVPPTPRGDPALDIRTSR